MANKFGLGSVWTSATRTITHGTNAVGNLASACEALSQNAELNAWVSVAQSSLELCQDLGVETKSPQEAMAATKTILETLRGY